MIRYYLELRLLDDVEISKGFLWSRVYSVIHRALVEIKTSDGSVPVGVSFPEYGDKRFPLGMVLRLFGTSPNDLESLQIEKVLASFDDYIEIETIKSVPDEIAGYALFYRKRFKTNPHKLAKRYAKRHEISLEEALKRYESFDTETVVKNNKLPFIELQSTSTGHRMKLFIEKIEADRNVTGAFSTFGLSKGATVPVF